ncbi:ferrous iron transport protein B [Colwellia psychrerythraea]|uniref:Ferrous iron transport protein B n=1 Tax=Colwellia psychrerythraea TaxID=28229 RepID=A0A099KW70_COLPS|nr:ferrous iron transport protein B [Colwellia psychrerythraea]KGJ94984.1 ferrous iron transport protein B [Colwellia psychrerythraea]
MKQSKHFALVGFANSGKSTLFNLLLSGHENNKNQSKQKVGNWSGVTVAAKKTSFTLLNQAAFLSDLPGLSSLERQREQGKDLTISQTFLQNSDIDCLVNVVDISQLSRQLYLTSQLLELGVPMIVVLNKSDRQKHLEIDLEQLSAELGCPVIAISAQRGEALAEVQQALSQVTAKLSASHQSIVDGVSLDKNKGQEAKKNIKTMQARYDFITDMLARVSSVETTNAAFANPSSSDKPFSERIDSIVLHPIMGVPVFLGVMYLLFMFAINVGSAFIDFFDILSGTLFVAYPLHFLAPLDLPQWLLTIVEGFGSGIQTVATFIPVIACLFIGLSLLESSGYLARAAFVVDSVMQKIGLPGKAFVPLIVGFGCTVPAVMSARILDSERERITTIMMSPFMSCGARLPVYALFAAAFFPDNGQNLVFLLYLVGIAAAIFTGFLLKKTVLSGTASLNIMELPHYEMPKISDLSQRVWQRTSGFVTGAGKTIVIVVCLLNFFNSIGTDGQFGHQDSENSVLSQSAKVVMPLLAPMGVQEDNWQAGVGIITGIFAKEVLVATFNNLYSPHAGEDQEQPSLIQSWQEATDSIKENLLGIAPDDPLGISVGEISDLNLAAQEQGVELSTYQRMQLAFVSQLGAFSYLLFILLYTPCVAAMGAIKNEVGSRWAGFAAVWSFTFAYLVATLCYQIGNFMAAPLSASITISFALLTFVLIYFWLKHKGKRVLTIPVKVSYS